LKRTRTARRWSKAKNGEGQVVLLLGEAGIGKSRYERRSMLITANQPFGDWGKVFPDQAMTLAAIDRLVHHSIIFEMNVESYRRRAALDRKRGPGRPPTHATIKEKAD
jgi:hypothetical protein